MNGVYKEHRERCLLERETSMMPATTAYVAQEVSRRENERLLDTLRKERARLRVQMFEVNHNIARVAQNITPPLEQASSFVQRCLVTGCRGYLSRQWKCGVCQTYCCPHCYQPKRGREDDEHVCDEEAIATIKLIRSDSKKCPKCSIFVTKVDGCDQMWCTQCTTSFSWRTGAILTGPIHNPHMIEAMRNGGALGRDVGDIPCGGAADARETYTTLARTLKIPTNQITFACEVARLVSHIQYVEVPSYPIDHGADENIRLRVSWMMKEIDDAKFRVKLQRKEKDMQKKREYGLIFQMLQHTLGDEVRRLLIDAKAATCEGTYPMSPNVSQLLRTFYTRCCKIVECGNNAFRGVQSNYDCVGPAVCVDTMRVVHHLRAKNILAPGLVPPSHSNN